jgi:hypothetical protein
MACIDYNTWVTAKAACLAAQSGLAVKGYGYAGLRGLGVSPPPPPTGYTAAPSTVSLPTLIIAPPNPSDPCVIAAQTPCPATEMPANPNAVPNVPGYFVPPAASTLPAPGPSATTVPTPAVAGGFNSWGLLAALAVGGIALALVLTHKKKPV